MKRIKLALHYQMGLALVLGATGGVLLGDSFDVWGNFINGIGNIFLHAINMVVIPLVFLSTALGISTMGDSKSMGRIAAKTFGFFIFTAIVAAFLGVVITSALRPGYGTHGRVMEIGRILNDAQQSNQTTLMDRIADIVPNNIFEAFSNGEILPIILFSILLGYFVIHINEERQRTVNATFEAFNDAIMKMTTAIIRFAPIGIFAIVMALVGKQAGNMAEMRNNLLSLAFFVIVVWISLIVMGGMVLPLMVGMMAHVSPLRHLKQIYSALMVAFSTSSSYSALPLIISDAKEKFGVSNNIASFTVPLGITFNKVGTIIYECVAVIFVAQAVGMELTAAQQISLIGASIVTVLGAPSVPMAGVVVLAILLNAMGLPTDYIGMFMAIDILCDMPKTLLNAYSVSCSAIIVAHSEGEALHV
ncbi:MAG: Proton/glutamate-aspartate symporter [Bacteroides thetaiotaomicron]